ncbi:ABC transporter substrate-binding protein [Paracoccus laeviglucosivorans]|uniref:Peptide/nickel transport system substrate-binding protein n=1 Tax=Paracoccus laeviglucosivorans TaxID=1197861 RepID=A0A521ESA8_9RHOB|nr:ABC transporter substrate-binding protein [Paracoccus laeviglucosivorans]SMO86809.1 peptide/nickel transport system substrate-binding protein [Paracoccus laeviglucosivorans]
MTVTRRQFHQIILAAGAFVALPGGGYAATTQPVSGGTLKIAYFPEPSQLVAINTSAGGAQFVGSKLFDGLLTYDYDLTPRPSLAREWSVSPDGLEYVFQLEHGAKFHDGQPLTSADVAFSILRLKDAHPRGRITFAHVAGVDSADPHVVRIRLDKPAPALLSALAASESPIVPKHIYEALDPAQNPTREQLLGSGPFVLKEWVPGSHIRLERNADYWAKGQPHLDQVIIRLIGDAGARAAALETGEVDIGENPVALADVERFRAVQNLRVDDRVYVYAGLLNQLVLNLDTSQLQNLKVRQAIAHAIDVQALINVVLHGYAIPSPTPIPPSFKAFHDPDIGFAKFDTALAEKLLDEAGFPRQGDGTRFKLRVTTNPFNAPTYSDFIAQSLIAVGIAAEIQRFDFATYVKTIYTDRAWDLSVESLSTTFDPTVGVQRVYWSKNFKLGLPFSNASHYANPEVDRLLEAAAIEPDVEKRAQLFKDFQKIIAQDLPVINLAVPVQPVVSSLRVHEYAPGAAGLGGNAARTWIAKA